MSKLMVEERKARERRLQNERFADDNTARGRADRFYGITRRSHRDHRARLLEQCRGKRVLEIGCGGGANVLELAKHGAIITGIDLSDVAVEKASANALRAGIDNAQFLQMDAETLEFPDASFDIVCGGAILHHLDTTRAFNEIARVLAPDGRALFLEPLGYNPFINLYRRITPDERTPDEHPLLEKDLTYAQDAFAGIDITYYYLTALLALPLVRKPFAKKLVERLNDIDARLFKTFPALRKYAWIIVLELTKPRLVHATA
ncbi:MAG: class I SAM-dependent methyltransferase [Candidatus Eremiobacteraeota bacterium]|nr:class I SAM-dependent methyltransferase [Candidatus Eremiobacteraeota bacterium]